MSKFKEPELLVDDHHGVYCGQFAYQWLLPYLQQQIKDKIGEKNVASIDAGPEDEFYWEAVDRMEDVKLTDENGVEFYIMFREGGVWVVPVSYMDTPEYVEWFC